MMLTWLEDVLRDAGLTVDVLPGWTQRASRGRGVDPQGVVCHHTVTPPSWPDHRVDHLLRDGHSTLSGPLSQLGLRRDGSYIVVAAGRCNHNGYGDIWGNDSIGIEAYNDGKGEPWGEQQMDAYVAGTAAICRHMGWGTDRVLGHKETDPGRKSDPTFDMDAFRARVDAALTAPQEDIVTPEDIDKVADAVVHKLVGDDTAWLDLRLLRLGNAVEGRIDELDERLVERETAEAAIRTVRNISKAVGAEVET